MNFKSEWVIQMFEEAGRSVPPKVEHERIFNSTIEYVWPKVHSAIPGIIESIKFLHSAWAGSIKPKSKRGIKNRKTTKNRFGFISRGLYQGLI